LTIPHKFLHHRHFVLIPLAEICPNWIHPKFGTKINFMLNKLSTAGLNSVKKI
jgi:2-amino-4-hydroxy-6-hydroxymethyldihydropteridine diphosphokinase